MIEATCSACGTLNRIAETDVPPGAKFVTCASCKSRVAVPNKTISGGAARPAAKPGAPAGDVIDLADLPAPKRASPLGGTPNTPPPPLPKPMSLDGGDLPAPKAARPGMPKPPPPQAGLNLDDLLAPSEPDLPAPKSRGRVTDLPSTKPGDVLDLPTPRAARGVTDLPMPKSLKDVADLPAPKGISNLPAPKAGAFDPPTSRNADPLDLPAPKGKTGTSDLPMPKGKGATDLPAPKGGLDLPAPKGFFDDLPQPASRNAKSTTTDIAPKGFFDDLPQPSGKGKAGTDIAPKGFFDDLPQPSGKEAPQAPAPKGYFEDLPQRAKAGGAQELSPVSFSKTPAPASDAIELSGPDLDLGPASGPSLGAAGSSSYNDIDISTPSAPQSPTQHASQQPRPAPAPSGLGLGARELPGSARGMGAEAMLELEADPRNRTQQLPQTSKKDGPKSVDATTAKRKLSRNAGIAIVAGIAVLGGGGFFMYRRHAAAAERGEIVDEQLKKARTAMAATDSGHWARATMAAKKILDEADDTNSDALGIAAESQIAGALDDGANAAIRLINGRKVINQALSAGTHNDNLSRAQALNAITMGQADVAIAKLTPMAAASKDGFVSLYLAWAQTAKGDLPAAIAAFDQAAKTNPALEIPALYGRGRAKLVAGDLAGAHADFTAILDNKAGKDHIGAMVGQAAAQPPSKSSQQESDLLAILARKDIATADPRAVITAWVLAGDDATRGARLDAARERYRKALELDANSVAALTGLAEVELKDGKLDAANEAIVKALTQAKDDAHAQIVASELSVRSGRLDDAEERIKVLEQRQPPLPPLDMSRLMMVKGHLLEAQKKDEAAVAAYIQGAKIAGDLDLSPTLAAIDKLGKLGQKARAEELLGGLVTKAESDPLLQVTLGSTYLQIGNYAEAEKWLRRASDSRPSDADAMFQLAKAMAKTGKLDDSIASLKKAMDIDPSRTEIGLELARTYEGAGRDADAGQLYDKLLSSKDPNIQLRGHAGRFYARMNPPQIDKAAAQGAEILKVDPDSPAGMYLRGEGLLLQGKVDEARKSFHAAVVKDADFQYLDAEGRASEKEVETTGDTKFYDPALSSYFRSHEAQVQLNEDAVKHGEPAHPLLFNPLAGQGRIYIAKHEWKKAMKPLRDSWDIKHDGDVAFMIGVASMELQDKNGGKQWLAEANKLKPNAEASRRLGTLYLDANQALEARNAFATATRLAENEQKKTGQSPKWLADAYWDLATTSEGLGDLATARDSYEKYLGQNPSDPGRISQANKKLSTSLKR